MLSKELVVAKTKKGVKMLDEDAMARDEENIFYGVLDKDEWYYIWDNVSVPAMRDHGIDINDREYDEIPSELVDYFFDLIGDNRDKAPVFCEALEWCKKSGGVIQVCF
ncbi:MAG: hypothetical protein KHW70_08030 [Clostridium sp.]|jgi:hypothetical protein|nr:hypothetical protein [Clostridium sp.]